MGGTIREHIEIVEGLAGPKAVIAGHRIRVEDVVIWYHKLGMSMDEIVDQFPTITPADVFAALAYYWDNREEIESQIGRGREFIEKLQKEHPSQLEAMLRRRQLG